MLESAIITRIGRFDRDMRLFSVLAVFSFIIGFGGLSYLWVHFQSNQEVVIQHSAKILSVLVTGGGATSYCASKAFSLREQSLVGRDLLDLHVDAAGPPPREILGKIQDRVLDWLAKWGK